jgi:hypothetical protein
MAGHVTTGDGGGDAGAGGDTSGGMQQPKQPVKSDSTTGGEIRADTAGMRSGAQMFETTADYAGALRDRFISGTSRLEGVWGTDKTGKGFETEYRTRITGAIEALTSIGEGLDALPESVRKWAQSYAQAEEDNAAIADDMSRQTQAASTQLIQPGSGATTQYAETRTYARQRSPHVDPELAAKMARRGDADARSPVYPAAQLAEEMIRQGKAGLHDAGLRVVPAGRGESFVVGVSSPMYADPKLAAEMVRRGDARYLSLPSQDHEGAELAVEMVRRREAGADESAPAEPKPLRNADGTVNVTDRSVDPRTGQLTQPVRRVPMQKAPKPVDVPPSAPPG